MHAVPRRLEVVEQLAFGMESHFTRRRAFVLEQIARADELQELILDVVIGPADVIDVEPAVGTFVAEHEGSRRDARNGVRYIVVGEPEGPKKSCACHRFRRFSTSRERNHAHTGLTQQPHYQELDV
jgi:hypothetical protein